MYRWQICLVSFLAPLPKLLKTYTECQHWLDDISAVIWLRYCHYGAKPCTINQSIDDIPHWNAVFQHQLDKLLLCIFLELKLTRIHKSMIKVFRTHGNKLASNGRLMYYQTLVILKVERNIIWFTTFPYLRGLVWYKCALYLTKISIYTYISINQPEYAWTIGTCKDENVPKHYSFFMFTDYQKMQENTRKKPLRLKMVIPE